MVGASDSSNIRARDDSQYLFKIRLEIDLARKVGVEVQAGEDTTQVRDSSPPDKLCFVAT